MKLLLLLAVCVATVVNGGRIHFRRTNTELVDMFSDLNNDLASKLAEKLETINLDLTDPMTEEDPEKTWRAVETVVTTVVEEGIPTHCQEAVAVHAVAGYTRHIVMEIVLKDMLKATEEIGELTYLEKLMPRKSEETGNLYRDLKPRLMSRIHKWKMTSGEASSVDRVIEVIAVFAGELKDKLEAVETAIGEVHMERLFLEIQSLIYADIMTNKPIGKVLEKVAITVHKYMEPFKNGKVSCHVTADLDEIERSLSDVIDFLDGGFEESLESVRIPRHMKEILKEELMATLPKVAEILKELVESFPTEEPVSFITSLFRENAGEVFRGVKISREVNEIVREGSLVDFVERLIRDGRTEEIAKMMLEIPAMTFGYLYLSPREIRYALREVAVRMVEGKLPEEAGPRGEYRIPHF